MYTDDTYGIFHDPWIGVMEVFTEVCDVKTRIEVLETSSVLHLDHPVRCNG